MDFPTAHLSLPMEAVPPSALRHGVASRTTRLPLSPHCNPFSVLLPFDSLGVFHHSLSASLASFADRVSKGDHDNRSGQSFIAALFPHPPAPRKAGYVCTQRYDTWSMHRIAGSQSASYTARKYHIGSTSVHKSRSPRKQGRDNHAIGKRPESASARGALPPSTHPKLGVSSRHHGFHRCALQRIFRPSLGNGRSD